ncbi:macrophage mannose receptor 1-like [Erpetoichthys calabaricus]|uniref:macrophage mannose receptor 1-like n=1 Tax=Erpetoichthys calabaricus TaxID=27687 RepID=UPI002234A639|nr:macrophage mannose receptor 1-like [Erpetoichthys calabaricus]
MEYVTKECSAHALKQKNYTLVTTSAKWDDALTYCKKAGQDLASVVTVQERDKATSLIQRQSQKPLEVWVGLQKKKEWTWSDGSPVNILFLSNLFGFVKDPCGRLTTSGFQVSDCNTKLPFLCQSIKDINVANIPPDKVSSVVTNYSTNEFYLVRDLLSWADAQRFCQNNFTDLASLHPPEQEDVRLKVLNMSVTYAWIGLSKPAGKWVWTDNTNLEVAEWAPGEPDNYNNNEYCAMFYVNGWNDKNCAAQFPFLCYRGKKSEAELGEKDKGCQVGNPVLLQNQKKNAETEVASTATTVSVAKIPPDRVIRIPTQFSINEFYFVNYSLNWADAKSYCEVNFTSLTSLKPTEQEDVRLKVLSWNEVFAWIGLSKLEDLWVWTDGTELQAPQWSPGEPNNFNNNSEYCAMFWFNGWNDMNCAAQFPFVCYRGKQTARARVIKSETPQIHLWGPLENVLF